MAKGRGSRGREEKKPKADKKTTMAPTSFLRPQAQPSKLPVKGARTPPAPERS